MMILYALTAAYANQRMPFKYLSTWICIMLTVRMVLGPGIGGAIYSNVLQERQQYYITRYAQNVDLLNPDASTSFLGTVQGMKYQGKSERKPVIWQLYLLRDGFRCKPRFPPSKKWQAGRSMAG